MKRMITMSFMVCAIFLIYGCPSSASTTTETQILKQELDRLYAKGIVRGVQDQSFQPQQVLTTEELLAFLARISGEEPQEDVVHTDKSKLNWTQPYIAWGIAHQLVDRGQSRRSVLSVAQTNKMLDTFSQMMNVDPIHVVSNGDIVTRGEVVAALDILANARDKSTMHTVTGGQIQGYQSPYQTDVAIYKGIPYAAAPIGTLRWKAPQPVDPWDGIRQTVSWGPSAIQPKQIPSGSWSKEFLIHDQSGYSEDNLYLNVWTKKDSKRNKPVIVYIHGGAFSAGGTSADIYDGEYMASQDAVYVSLNYRLGIFGFLTHPQLENESETGSSGNYGLMDQIQALKWVKNNISTFGGDPENVTLMGQSAGAISVQALMVSPQASGLFNKAIAMSFNMANSNLPTSEQLSNLNTNTVGKFTLEELRDMSAEQLQKLPAFFWPVIDGQVLKENFSQAMRNGHANQVPLISGMVPGDSMSLLSFASVQKPKDYTAAINKIYGKWADRFLTLYPVQFSNVRQVIQQLSNDQLMAQQSQLVKQRKASSDKETYVYLFNHVLPGPDSVKYGAFHTSDVPYFLHNFSDTRSEYWKLADVKVAYIASQYVLNFARTSNPNGIGLPDWKPSNGTDEYMNLSEHSQLQTIHDKRAALWEDYLTQTK